MDTAHCSSSSLQRPETGTGTKSALITYTAKFN